mmetsp:Transcript_8892/g.13342  ORF Transcript_8892/g.13342 Transcript_8892/m.13342 type:complete len:362 (+) Transcript_8892:86-1171(+)
MSSLTLVQQQLATTFPRISGSFSLLGSLSITVDIIRKYRKDAKKVTAYHRLILGMSFCDMVMSVAHIMATWPIPSDTPGAYAAYGNEATCNAQGFFGQFGIGSPFYNLFLTVYYYLLIVKDSKLSRNQEICMHVASLSFAFGTATAALALGFYGSVFIWCWITSEHTIVRLVFWYGPLWVIFIVVAVLMSVIYFNIKRQEHRQIRWSQQNIGNGRPKFVSDSVRWQAFRYVGAFFITWIFLTIVRVCNAVNVTAPFWVLLLAFTLMPMQGLFNYLIYIRPRYATRRKEFPEVGRIKTFLKVNPLLAGCKCCGCEACTLSNIRSNTTQCGSNTVNLEGRDHNSQSQASEVIMDEVIMEEDGV